MCAFFFSLALTEFVTNFVKLYVGRFRPNFYDMCGFDINTLKCTASESYITQGRTSFPSGHASMSACGMSILSHYLLGKISLMQTWEGFVLTRNEFLPFRRFLQLCAMSPYIAAIWVSASRIHDNWHHPSDVLAGSVIGYASACLSYFMFYPSLFDPKSAVPYSASH